MKSFFISCSSLICPKVLPKDGIAYSGLENNAGARLGVCSAAVQSIRTLNELAPSVIIACAVHVWELSASTHQSLPITFTLCSQPYHETAYSSPASGARTPVKVMCIVTASDVALRAKPLYPKVTTPALE